MLLKILDSMGLTNLSDDQVSRYYDCVADTRKSLLQNWWNASPQITKLAFLLIVYFAGFVTAIYYLAPAHDEHNKPSNSKQDVAKSYFTKQREFVESFKEGMHKMLDKTEEIAGSWINKLKDKTEESKPSNSNKLEDLKQVEEKKEVQDANM